MRLACGPVKTLTETRGRRSRRPLAASLLGFASHLCSRTRNRTRAAAKTRARSGPSKSSRTLCSHFVCVCVCFFKSISHLFPPHFIRDPSLQRASFTWQLNKPRTEIHHNPVDLRDVCPSFSELDFTDNPVCRGLDVQQNVSRSNLRKEPLCPVKGAQGRVTFIG